MGDLVLFEHTLWDLKLSAQNVLEEVGRSLNIPYGI